MFGDRLSGGQGLKLWTRQTGREMEAVSCLHGTIKQFKIFFGSRCLYALTAKRHHRGRQWHNIGSLLPHYST